MKRSRYLIKILLIIGISIFIHHAGYSETDPELQKKVNEAVDRGINFLLKKPVKARESELFVLALLHTGVDPKKNSALAQGITQIANSRVDETYRVALSIMALEMADRQKYQLKIADFAQAIVSSQCENGQWDYNCKSDLRPIIGKEPAQLIEVITGSDGSAEKKSPSSDKQGLKKIIVKRGDHRRAKEGDNSNTQFALLGLRSAARCGVEIPEETWKDAATILEKKQLADGGWSYGNPTSAAVSYGSITCAALCGLVIAKFYLKQDIQNDPAIQKGLAWLAGKFTFNRNPGLDAYPEMRVKWQYYYIYGIERVGAVLSTDHIGEYDWYANGVKYLISAQNQKDGSWNSTQDDPLSIDVSDTCFALLFLRKATPKLKAVQTGPQ